MTQASAAVMRGGFWELERAAVAAPFSEDASRQ
jgi:hypothetical protein